MTSEKVEAFISHHGVKGMRWGVRKARTGNVRKLPETQDSRKVSELKKRKPKQLTNKQLKTVNDRLNMEKNFKKLNPNKVEKGHNAAKAILAVGSTVTALYALSTTPAGKALIARGKKALRLAEYGQMKLPGIK